MLGIADDARGQIVEGEEVGDEFGLGILHHVTLDHIRFRTQQPVTRLLDRELDDELEVGEVFHEQHVHLFNVLGAHGPQTGQLRQFGQFVAANGHLHRHVLLQVREADVDQLLGVERAVVVAALTDRRGQHHTGRVDCLPHIGHVDAARDLADQHGRESLAAQ